MFSSSLRLSESSATKVVTEASQDRVLKKIDLTKDLDKLTPTQRMFIEKLNSKANEKFAMRKKLKKHYRVTGAILGSIVLSIYFYTMFAIRQEKFLDDFEVPEPPDSAVRQMQKDQQKRAH